MTKKVNKTYRISYWLAFGQRVNEELFLKKLVSVLSHLSLEGLSYSNLCEQKITSSLPSLDGKSTQTFTYIYWTHPHLGLFSEEIGLQIKTYQTLSPVRRTFVFVGSRCTQPLTSRNARALRYEFSKWRTGQRGK